MVRLIRWKFLPKVLAVAAGLWVFWVSDFHWLGFAVYFFAFLFSHLSFDAEERRTLRFASLSLFFGTPLFLVVFSFFVPGSGGFSLFLPTALLFAFFLFLLFGFFQSCFENRRLVFRIAQSGILLASFLLLFFLHSFSGFWFSSLSVLWFASLFLIAVLFSREFFRFFGIFQSVHGWVWSMVLGVLAVEFSWVLLLFPLGFIGNALLLASFLVLAREGLLAHEADGRLSWTIFLWGCGVFALLFSVVFSAAPWPF